MEEYERTRDIFEYIPAYPKPPLIPLAAPDDLSEFFDNYIKSKKLAVHIIGAARFLTGFKKFQERLPESLEIYLRQTDTRTPGLFSPVISATLALKDDPGKPDPLERAVSLLVASRNLRDDLYSGKFAPDFLNDQVLEMGEYPNLFSTSLIIDNKTVRIFKSTIDTHIIAAFEGKFYYVNICRDGNILPANELYASIKQIIAKSGDEKADPGELSPGIITAASDSIQIPAFRKLQKNRINYNTYKNFRHSFLTLCLDLKNHPSTDSEAAKLAHSGNYANRWYHSSLQIVVFGNAKACIICNFTTYIAGNTMARACAEIQSRATEYQSYGITSPPISNPPVPLPLELTFNRKYVMRAKDELRRITNGQQATFEIMNMGKKFFAENNINSTSAFILILQMAAKKLTGKIIPITQFLSLTRFRCMDLTTTVVTTPEVNSFTEYIFQEIIQKEKARQLLYNAVDSQLRKCRKAREYLSLNFLLTMFLRTQNGTRRIYTTAVVLLSVILLKMFRLLRPQSLSYGIIVSHPAIYTQIPVVGRPGIRLPYVKYFAMHYQIWEDRTVITIMPSLKWEIPNEQIISELQKCFDMIKGVFTEEAYKSKAAS